MEIRTFWVGDRPAGAWTFEVLNQKSGLPENLVGYSSARVKMLGSDNEDISIPDANTSIASSLNGLINFTWPAESLFTKPGRYVMQLELVGPTAVRRTTVQEILVKKMGGVSK